MANREQLKRYAQFKQLCDDPMSYARDCRVVLFPNGDTGKIWVSDKSGRCSMQIEIGCGKSGLSVRVKRSVGTVPITIHGNQHPDYEVQPPIEMAEVDCTQYFSDRRSQAVKTWYGLDMRSIESHDIMEKDENARTVYKAGIAAALKHQGKDHQDDCDGLGYCPTRPNQSPYIDLFDRGWWETKAGMHDPKQDPVPVVAHGPDQPL